MWKRDGTQVTLDTAQLAAKVDVARPQFGVGELVVRWHGRAIPLTESRILRVQFPPEMSLENVSESWVRGDDVVAIYSPTMQRPFCPEIYWRSLRSLPSTCAGMELIVSVHTDQLDAATQSIASSELTSDEVLWLAGGQAEPSVHTVRAGAAQFTATSSMGPGTFVFRSATSPLSYVEMIHPSDFCLATLGWRDHLAEVRWELFPESLEKGVIRRARLRSLWVPRNNDVAEAARHFGSFGASAPPLTT